MRKTTKTQPCGDCLPCLVGAGCGNPLPAPASYTTWRLPPESTWRLADAHHEYPSWLAGHLASQTDKVTVSAPWGESTLRLANQEVQFCDGEVMVLVNIEGGTSWIPVAGTSLAGAAVRPLAPTEPGGGAPAPAPCTAPAGTPAQLAQVGFNYNGRSYTVQLALVGTPRRVDSVRWQRFEGGLQGSWNTFAQCWDVCTGNTGLTEAVKRGWVEGGWAEPCSSFGRGN